jgi:predicted ArsR family transcriptional regulator
MGDPRLSAYRTLACESRVRILNLLQTAGAPCTVDDLAADLGLSVSTTRDHLDRLVAGGFVQRDTERRTIRGRPRKLYRALDRPSGATMDSRAREHLTRLLLEGYGRPMEHGSAEEAGERWGDAMAREPQPTRRSRRPRPWLQETSAQAAPPFWGQLAALEQHFEDLGFEPTADPARLEVHLHRCPLADLAQSRTEIVCNVHLGLAKGVLAAHGGPLTADRLEPFVGPQHCILHLRDAVPAPPPLDATEERVGSSSPG